MTLWDWDCTKNSMEPLVSQREKKITRSSYIQCSYYVDHKYNVAIWVCVHIMVMEHILISRTCKKLLIMAVYTASLFWSGHPCHYEIHSNNTTWKNTHLVYVCKLYAWSSSVLCTCTWTCVLHVHIQYMHMYKLPTCFLTFEYIWILE